MAMDASRGTHGENALALCVCRQSIVSSLPRRAASRWRLRSASRRVVCRHARSPGEWRWGERPL